MNILNINYLRVKHLECSLPPLIIGRHSFGRSDFSVTSVPIRSPCLSVYILNNPKWDWPLTSAVMRFNPVSTVAFEECYCLIWESGIIGQPCEWGPMEQWGLDLPPPHPINTLWAENKSVKRPAFSTVLLCCCLWIISSWVEKGRERQEERYKEKQTVKRRKEWDILLCTAVCEGREGCCVPVGSVGSKRWPTDTSSSQNSIVHMFSSLTHSPHTDPDLTPTAVSSGAIHLCC